MMGRLVHDIRFAVRGLARRPVHTILAVGTLGLGIGASTAMFSVVQGVLLAPLPWGESDQIVAVYPTNPNLEGHPTLGDAAVRGTFSNPEVELLAQVGKPALSHIAILAPISRRRLSQARVVPGMQEKP